MCGISTQFSARAWIVARRYSRLTCMKKIIVLVRKILKQPLILLIYILSRCQRYTSHGRISVPNQLKYLLELYEIETTRFFKKHIKKGMTVVDAGANDGYFTRLFSKLVGPEGRVYAFEPDRENYPRLIENTKHLKNVTVYPYAVSDEDGEATWYHVIGANECHSLLPYDASYPKKNIEEQKVKVVTLDSIIPEKIDVLKIDVEGAEDKVFRGMKRHLQESPWVAFEYTKGFLDSFIEELKLSGTLYSTSSQGDLQPLEEAHYTLEGRKEHPLTNLVYKHRVANG